MYSVYYPFMSCVIAYLFIHTIFVSSFVLCIYLCTYFFKILCSAVPRSLISYRVIISSNYDCGQVKECQWRLTILTLLLTFAQLSASPKKVFFFVYGKCRLYVESVEYFWATFIARIFQRSCIDKAPENHAARGPRGSMCPPKYWVLKFVVNFFRTEFVFSSRREYSDAPFWDFGIVTGGGGRYLHHWMNIIEQGFPTFLPWKNP
jgi:hypothetical protein